MLLEGNVNWISPTSKIQETMQGQTATAEIVVRKRRVIDFILEPFQKLQNTCLKL